ncbi:hypothetical protein B0H14DRAFT_2651821 [Mycena olivaceomarginata]|nr:hypothetical protein B0H14DRAFT_2651821 [Mycena olivaceomarginata]
MTYRHNWGIPGIDVPPPPLREGYMLTRNPTPFNTLKFGPLGLYELRRRLGVHANEPGVFQQFQTRFLASDIAWFAGGASTDGQHLPRQPGFFSEFDRVREALPKGVTGSEARRALSEKMQHALFDIAPPCQTPPSEPQYLRAATYLPPSFLAAQPASHPAIARIVQTFIESIGVPTVQEWRSNALLKRWPLTQPGPGAPPNPPSSVLIPQPLPNSSHYKFFGRPVGVLDAILSAIPPPVPVVIIDDDDDLNGDLMDAMERESYAEVEASGRLRRIHELEEEVDGLTARISELEERNAQLRMQLSGRHTAVTARSTPGTPSRSTLARSQPHTTTRAAGPRTPARTAGSPRQPPPYSPSAPYPHSPRPLHANSRAPLAARSHAVDDQADALDLFLDANDLQDVAVSIRLVIRGYHAGKWYEELSALGISPDVVSGLIDVASNM